MLKHLYIKNYALIDTLDIEFNSGFSVITGETGAGKSIILGAIGMLLGQRADTKAIRRSELKCTIEAHFDLSRYGMKEWFDEEELDSDDLTDCIIRREVTPTGKSRGFINDTPVTLAQMRQLGEMLIDVHSQHQNLLLQKEDFQLNVVDIIAHNEKERADYALAYKAYRTADEQLKDLRQQMEQTRDNEEFMRFQLNELTNANLIEGEQEELEQEQRTATHAEDIKTALYTANSMLSDDDGAVEKIRQAANSISNVAAMAGIMTQTDERMESLLIELKDIAHEVAVEADNIEFDPARMETISNRLDTIYTLQHKFRKETVEELIAEREALRTAIDNIDNSDLALSEKENEVKALMAKAREKADILTKTRQKASKKVETEVITRLGMLGMPNVVFNAEIKEKELATDGHDKLAFLFSANKGMTPRPVADVASGGEIARLMLSLKAMISGAVKLPTIIFDEIDTGVSGKVAEKMAEIMRQMGEANRQVISITHLPQIAARGKYHYKVEKHDTDNGTTSAMRQLNDEERIDEIAQMLSGEDISEAARNNAKTLLKTK